MTDFWNRPPLRRNKHSRTHGYGPGGPGRLLIEANYKRGTILENEGSSFLLTLSLNFHASDRQTRNGPNGQGPGPAVKGGR